MYYLKHDVETAMLKYVRCSENFNMQFSGRLLVQTYIDTFVYFLPV